MTSSLILVGVTLTSSILVLKPMVAQSTTTPLLINLGQEEIVFDWTTDRCATEDIPDLPARAFRDSNGKTHLISTHFTNREMVGDSLGEVARICDVILASHFDADPAKFNDKEWISAIYTTDGTNIHALLHSEYQGSSHSGMCPSGNYSKCWYNAITYASSNDMGGSYSHATAPQHRVANVPYPYVADAGPYGIFEGSNIIYNTGAAFYYKLLHLETYGEQQWGTGVMRTQSLSDPGSWRCWDGEGFNATFIDPYVEENFNPADHVCEPVSRANIEKMADSVTYNTFLNKFVLVGASGLWNESNQLIHGFYYSFSDDLVNWTPRQLLLETKLWWTPQLPGDPLGYPSLIDPTDTSLNFEYTDNHFYLYYTRWHSGTVYDRDLVRRPVTFYFDADGDGVANTNDNCLNISNPEQENLDGDGLGDTCDNDVDGDNSCIPGEGQVENDCDLDDDNDGLSDVAEDADELLDPFNPDSDGDGIRDGLDASPTVMTNTCDPNATAVEQFLNINITAIIQCAAPEGVLVKSGTHIKSTGGLQVITPKTTSVETGVKVDANGELSITIEVLPGP